MLYIFIKIHVLALVSVPVSVPVPSDPVTKVTGVEEEERRRREEEDEKLYGFVGPVSMFS